MKGVRVTLPEECKYLIDVQEGRKYIITVAPLMHSRLVLLDTNILEEMMRAAYQAAKSTPAPRVFALRLLCKAAATMQFEVVAEEKYVADATMLTLAPKIADVKIDQFFKRAKTCH